VSLLSPAPARLLRERVPQLKDLCQDTPPQPWPALHSLSKYHQEIFAPSPSCHAGHERGCAKIPYEKNGEKRATLMVVARQSSGLTPVEGPA